MTLPPIHMIFTRKGVAGSLIGGIPETQEMLDFCGRHHITAEVEMIAIQDINEATREFLRGMSSTASSSIWQLCSHIGAAS